MNTAAIIQGVFVFGLIIVMALFIGFIIYYIIEARKYKHKVILFDDHDYPSVYYARLLGYKSSDLKYFKLIRNKSIISILSKKKKNFEKPDDRYLYNLGSGTILLIGRYINDVFIPLEPTSLDDKLVTGIRELESARNWTALRLKENTYRTNTNNTNIIQLVSLGLIVLMLILGLVFISQMISDVSKTSTKNTEELSNLINKQVEIEGRLVSAIESNNNQGSSNNPPPDLSGNSITGGGDS